MQSGPTTLDVRETTPTGQNTAATSKLNIVSVSLSADKLNLMRGESTQLHITVNGLQGIKNSGGGFNLVLQNQSPEVIRFGSNPAGTMLKPISNQMISAINGDGKLILNEPILGTRAGSFKIQATIIAAGR